MRTRWVRLVLLLAGIYLWPCTAPAPLVYRPDEGWVYEPVGGAKWQRGRAKDQLEVAQTAFDKKEYGLALKAARRTVSKWPMSDYAPQAQYLVGRCYEAKKQDQNAFKQYQRLLEKYPKAANYQEVVERQFQIANRFLAGQWVKLWGHIPFFPSRNVAVDMYEKVIKNGPYSQVAPAAQLSIGQARERQKRYAEAVKAYERAADRYHDQPAVAADAMYKAGLAYYKQARKAEYDQSAASQAITTLADFAALYPKDQRVADAQSRIRAVYTDQARGSLGIAQYYEKKRRWIGAMTYYNEANDIMTRQAQDPDSKYAVEARSRVEAIRKRLPLQASPPGPAPAAPAARPGGSM